MTYDRHRTLLALSARTASTRDGGKIMGWREWIGGHDADDYDIEYGAYEQDFRRYGVRNGEQVYRRRAGSAGSPEHRWWATERYSPRGRPENFRGYASEYYGGRPRLSAGGSQGPGRAWGMGGNIEMESENYRWGPGEFRNRGRLPMDSLRRGSPRGGQQRAGRYYGHERDYGGRYLRGDTYRAFDADVDFGEMEHYDREYARALLV